MALGLLALVPSAHAGKHPKKKAARQSKTAARVHRERTSKESELAHLRQEIARYQSQLREHERQEKASKRNLSAYNRRTQQLEQAIAGLQDQVDALSERKVAVDSSLAQTNSSLDRLKEAYARSSRYLYMKSRTETSDADQALFEQGTSARSIRNRYYAHVIGEAHAMNRAKLDSLKQSLDHSSRSIARTLNAEQQQIGQHAEEEESVAQQREATARELQKIEQNKDRLRKLLAQRVASAKRLEGMIANLVAREEAAKRSARSSAHHNRTKHSRQPDLADEEEPSTGRSYGPHSLVWPSSSHRIKQGYGEHRNAELNTVTMNLGVDIGTPSGSAVVAAAEGEVSLVSSLPSYGTIIVLKHAGGLHTVYADLSTASVRPGTHVRAGQVIGHSGSNEETGEVLHFEVWKGRSKQNPLGWLK